MALTGEDAACTTENHKGVTQRRKKTFTTHFLIREKQPDFSKIQERTGQLQARTVNAVTLHF